MPLFFHSLNTCDDFFWVFIVDFFFLSRHIKYTPFLKKKKRHACVCVFWGVIMDVSLNCFFFLNRQLPPIVLRKIDKFNYESMHAYTVCGHVNKAYACECIYIHFVKKKKNLVKSSCVIIKELLLIYNLGSQWQM